MELPKLNYNSKLNKISFVNQFAGLNKGNVISESEWSDTLNVTNDNFPILTNRKKRAKIFKGTHIQGMCGGEIFSYVDNNKLYVDGEMVRELFDAYDERQIVMMGAKVCVFPDGFIYNYIDKKGGFIEYNIKDNVTISLYKKDTDTSADVLLTTLGTNANVISSKKEPTTPQTSDKKQYWYDYSGIKPVMMQYDHDAGMWIVIQTYIKIKFSSASVYEGIEFKKDDAITLYRGTNSLLNGAFILNEDITENGELMFDGICSPAYKQDGTKYSLRFYRDLPKLDFVCELNNRLYGCYSGYRNVRQLDGTMKEEYLNEIYACKLGDPYQWNDFSGRVSDSYVASVGSQSVFTGIASYGGYVMFFKNDGYHRLYGSKPSNFEVSWKAGRGVQKGSGKSVVCVGGYLMWKADDGICLYDGSTDIISAQLGNEPYYDAVGGAYRDKYYISMRDANYVRHLYVYDTKKRMWLIEDGTQAKFMAYTGKGLFIANDKHEVFCINNDSLYEMIFLSKQFKLCGEEGFKCGLIEIGEIEKDFDWEFDTGVIDFGLASQKYLKKVIPSISLDTNAKLRIEIEYDSSDEWMNVIEIYATRRRTYEIPVPVSRCNHFKLRFSGFGDFKLFNIQKEYERGSAMHG